MKTVRHKPDSTRSGPAFARDDRATRGEPFEEAARAALEGVRDALAVLLRALPQGYPERAVDLGRALGIGAELRWQAHTVAGAADAIEAGPHVPRPGSIRTLLDAARKKGLPARAIAGVREACGRYEQVVREHAGDRAAFDSMIHALSVDRADQVDEKVRRSLFTQQSALWGLRQRVAFRCTIFHAGASEGLIDGVNLMGSVGLHQLRSGVPLELAVNSYLRNELPGRSVVEAPGAVSPLMVLREFCSGPMPELEAHPYESGTQTMMRFEGMGKNGALNLALAQVVRGAGATVVEDYCGDVRVVTPSAVLCNDMLVPAGWSAPETVEARVYARRVNTEQVWEKRAQDRLPMRVSATHRGRARVRGGRSMPGLVDVPRYGEVVARVLGDLSWDGTEFDLYRSRVEYPVMHSLNELRVAAARR